MSKKRSPGASLSAFKLTDDEWNEVYKSFWKLSRHQAKSLLNMNTKGSHTEDQEDIEQEMCLSMVTAAMYYKRQCFIEDCFKCLSGKVKDPTVIKIINSLKSIWKPAPDTTRIRFGTHQEEILQRLINSYVPLAERPSPSAPFEFNEKFERYCKANTWNRIKTMGRKITKERSLRSGLASLSNFNYLVHSDSEPDLDAAE